MILNYISAGARYGVKTARFYFPGNDFIGFYLTARGEVRSRETTMTPLNVPSSGIKRACAFHSIFFTFTGIIGSGCGAGYNKKPPTRDHDGRRGRRSSRQKAPLTVYQPVNTSNRYPDLHADAGYSSRSSILSANRCCRISTRRTSIKKRLYNVANVGTNQYPRREPGCLYPPQLLEATAMVQS